MFAVLYLADFALQAVLRTERDAPSGPAALFAEHTKKSVVIAVNATAAADGVERGMTAPQAVARCPSLLIRTPNAGAEADARAALLAVGLTVAPSIEDTAPGVCTIDLKGSEPSTYERSAAAAVAQLTALGFIATAGIGETPLLALYAARAAAAPTSARAPSRPPAKSESPGDRELELPLGDVAPLAAEAAGPYGRPRRDPTPSPPGVLFVHDPASFLTGLPLAAAEPTPALADILARWGLHTLGDLSALPRDDIGRRLGPEGLALWDRARGGSPRPIHPFVPAPSFEAEMRFEDPVETLEPLLFILRRFLERLTLELRTGGHVAAELDLALTLDDDSTHQRSFRLPDPTADVDILFRALHTHLESLRTESPIMGVQLRATPARPLVRQQGLFETGLRDPHGFSETLARIVAIVGSDRVGTPHREDTHRPDAVKLAPPSAVIPPPLPPPLHPVSGLPLRRFRPLLPAQLELNDGRPTYLWTDRFSGAIAEVRGPWLSSGDWWQADRAWRRTEYDIALEKGGLYRLVLTDRAWFIEGEYD